MKKGVPQTQDIVVSHPEGTIQQKPSEFLFLPNRNRKAVKRPNPTEEESHITTSQTCEHRVSGIVELLPPLVKKLKVYPMDSRSIMENVFEKGSQATVIPSSPNLTTSKECSSSKTTGCISLDVTKSTCGSTYSFEDPYTSLMEFEDGNVLESSPAKPPSIKDNPAIAQFVQKSNSLYRGDQQLRETTFFKEWLDECVEVITD
jgi:hypothetical protein